MFYTIYQITNLIDGKIYIGKHQTNDLDDGYMGSGRLLKRAQEKHGLENFKKEILFQLDSEQAMNAKEAELVTEEFCLREDTYNLCPGGKGGWGYINQNTDFAERNKILNANRNYSAESFRTKLSVQRIGRKYPKISEANKGRAATLGMTGKVHSEEVRSKMSSVHKERISSQF